MQNEKSKRIGTALKNGWTTGACAAAATKAALTAFLTHEFPNPVTITLPRGEQPSFFLAHSELKKEYALAAIRKDAGDDPDVTHGALIIVRIEPAPQNSGIVFKAGAGVGIITRKGLPLAVGEAAINPVPRAMMREICQSLSQKYNSKNNWCITISVPNGAEIAKKTWNSRLGIIKGISILGTTGIVRPYSCSAWIYSIHQSIDVARANGQEHILAFTGSQSENCAKKLYNLPEFAYIQMGDFIGAVLKYLARYPVKKFTLIGGFAKLAKFAQGALNLHSAHSQIDKNFLYEHAKSLGLKGSLYDKILTANTALEILEITQKENIPLADRIAEEVQKNIFKHLKNQNIVTEIILVDRNGAILARRA